MIAALAILAVLGLIVLALLLADALRERADTDLYAAVLAIARKLDGMHATIKTQGVTMSAGLERLTTEVAESAGVVQSAVVAIQGLSERVRNLEPNQEAINALADDLDSNANALAAAIAAIPPPPSQG